MIRQGHHGPGRGGGFHGGADGGQGHRFGGAGSQMVAKAVITAQGAVGGGQEVPQSRQPVKGGPLPPQGLQNHPHLGQAPAEQGGFCIGAQAEPIADAGRHGHDVLHGARHLRADGIGIGIEAQIGGQQFRLQAFCQGCIVTGDHAGRRQTPIQFVGEVGPAEHGHGGLGMVALPELASAAETLQVDALAAAQQRHPRGPMACKGLGQRLHPRHRHCRNHQFAVAQNRGRQGSIPA